MSAANDSQSAHWTNAAVVSAISCISVCVIMIAPCAAQEAATVTDTELRAAYCLGAATDQVETISAELKGYEAATKAGRSSRQLTESRIAAEFVRNAVVERRDRMRDYLKVKGFLSGRSFRLIEVSLQRGAEDSRICTAVNSTGPSDACARVVRCVENFLPF
jgi:hypothetical protein